MSDSAARPCWQPKSSHTGPHHSALILAPAAAAHKAVQVLQGRPPNLTGCHEGGCGEVAARELGAFGEVGTSHAGHKRPTAHTQDGKSGGADTESNTSLCDSGFRVAASVKGSGFETLWGNRSVKCTPRVRSGA